MTDPAAATERPWRVRQHSFDDDKKSLGSVFQMVRDGHAYAVAMCPKYQTAERWNADAALIVQAVNERDQLLSDISSSKAEVERLREALDNSQSLFAMLHLIDPDPATWKAEGVSDLLKNQIAQNRAALNKGA